MWPFRRKQRSAKLALYNIKDYPRERFFAYPEISIQAEEPFKWRARMLAWSNSAVLAETTGMGADEHTARRQSQEWVLEQFRHFDRGRTVDVDPLPHIDGVVA